MLARKLTFMAIGVVVIALSFGCSSGGSDIVLPDTSSGRTSASGNHMLWGMFQFICDPANDTINIVPLRTADDHLNVLPFLEPPPLTWLTLESLEFNGNIIDADIGLKHPFLGLNEFTGFDVSGILISNGSYSGYSDSGINIPGPGDLYLVNADGYSRWWNPDEFPVNPSAPITGYKDGLLGTPDSAGNYDATVNGYKYFADGLAPDDPVDSIDKSMRGKFGAGQKNIRHYTIDLGDAGLVFNYAVDACWHFPNGPAPWSVPDDFGPEANRVEPYNIDVTEDKNTLWCDGSSHGGQLSLSIDVHDWFEVGNDWIRVESPGAFDAVDVTAASGGSEEYSTFEVDLNDIDLSSSDDLMILITAFCEDEGFQGHIPGETTAAYQVHYAAVSQSPTVQPPVAVADSIPKIGFTNFAGDFYAHDSTGEIDLYEWDFDGDSGYDWSDPSTGDTTHAYDTEATYDATLKVSNAGGYDTDVVQIRMIDPLPIILNGNFWDHTWDNWSVSASGVGSVQYSFVDDDTFREYAKFFRSGSGSDGGGIRAVQVLDADVSSYQHLYFNSFFRLVSQSLPGDGYWGSYGGWGEFPYFFIIFYLNQNDQTRFVCYGYILGNADGQWEWDKPEFASYHPGCAYKHHEANTPANVWQEKQTIDLMTLGADAPKQLTEIWIWSAGWNFEAHWILPWFSDH